MTTFNLPDLGAGLLEADIVAWHVKDGDRVELDQPMLSVETAKAVVEVPSPYSGTVLKLHAKVGDTVQTGKPLVDFNLPASASQPVHAQVASGAPAAAGQGMVVGHMASSDEEFVDRAIAGDGALASEAHLVFVADRFEGVDRVQADFLDDAGRAEMVLALLYQNATGGTKTVAKTVEPGILEDPRMQLDTGLPRLIAQVRTGRDFDLFFLVDKDDFRHREGPSRGRKDRER